MSELKEIHFKIAEELLGLSDFTFKHDAAVIIADFEQAATVELQARVAEAEADRYVPGVWRCPACTFQLTRSVLYVKSGTVGADIGPLIQHCPNDEVAMERVTWKEYAKNIATVCEQQIKRAYDAEQARDRLQIWKDQVMELERSWDEQAVGKALGMTLGVSIRANIMPGIQRLQQIADNLAAALRDALDALRPIHKPSVPPQKANMDTILDMKNAYIKGGPALAAWKESKK